MQPSEQESHMARQFAPPKVSCRGKLKQRILTRIPLHTDEFMLNQQCYSIHFSVEKEGTPIAEREGTQRSACYTVLFQHLQSRIKPALPRAVLGSVLEPLVRVDSLE